MQNENQGESLLDAINAAIPSEDAPEPTEEEVVETPEGEEVEAPEGEEAEGEETPEGEEPEGEEEPEQTPEEAAAAKAAADAAKKPPDPINDPLPKGTLQSTSERFKTVVGMLKEQTTRAETIEAQHNELIGEITGAGMGANEFAQLCDYARGVNSNTYDGMRAAYGILQKEMAALAERLGETLPGGDPLKGHDDLLKEVNDGKLPPQRAIEIAAERNRRAAQTRLGQQQQNVQQTSAQAAQATAQGKTALTALGKQLAAKDGQAEYTRKARIAVKILTKVMPKLPPGEWVDTFRAAYNEVPAAPKAATGGQPGNRPQPLRGNKAPAGAGAGTKQPKTLLEAMSPAFE